MSWLAKTAYQIAFEECVIRTPRALATVNVLIAWSPVDLISLLRRRVERHVDQKVCLVPCPGRRRRCAAKHARDRAWRRACRTLTMSACLHGSLRRDFAAAPETIKGPSLQLMLEVDRWIDEGLQKIQSALGPDDGADTYEVPGGWLTKWVRQARVLAESMETVAAAHSCKSLTLPVISTVNVPESLMSKQIWKYGPDPFSADEEIGKLLASENVRKRVDALLEQRHPCKLIAWLSCRMARHAYQLHLFVNPKSMAIWGSTWLRVGRSARFTLVLAYAVQESLRRLFISAPDHLKNSALGTFSKGQRHAETAAGTIVLAIWPRGWAPIVQRINFDWVEKFSAMSRSLACEVEGLQWAIGTGHSATLLPAPDAIQPTPLGDGSAKFMAEAGIAAEFNLAPEKLTSLRGKLERLRRKHLGESDLLLEHENRSKNEPRFLYNINHPLLRELVAPLAPRRAGGSDV